MKSAQEINGDAIAVKVPTKYGDHELPDHIAWTPSLNQPNTLMDDMI